MRQDLGAVMAMVALGGGCAIDGPVESDGVAEAVPRSAPAAAMAAEGETMIHVGGICSQHFADPESKGGGALGHWAGVASVDAWVDQRASMGQAVADLSKTLDRQCRGDAWCYVYAYSNGGAVVSRTLAQQDAERWNILWVFTTASNEGGSELSGGLGAQAAAGLGLSCDLAARISPSDHRAGWNHNDTAGNQFYGIGGTDEWWYTGGFPDFFGGDANDGAVAVHSSAGLNDTYAVPDDDPWLCYTPEAHYDNHGVAYRCDGYDLDHHAMKMQGIWELGG
ncbi:MAG: hypothetical protein KC731_17475 [Myxococcales bacterium]|nr:hypothetical protein [Myxococcales bacterium]